MEIWLGEQPREVLYSFIGLYFSRSEDLVFAFDWFYLLYMLCVDCG